MIGAKIKQVALPSRTNPRDALRHVTITTPICGCLILFLELIQPTRL